MVTTPAATFTRGECGMQPSEHPPAITTSISSVTVGRDGVTLSSETPVHTANSGCAINTNRRMERRFTGPPID